MFKPSPVKLVRFGDGKVVPLNRKTRRLMHLYGANLTKQKPAPFESGVTKS